MLRILNWVIKHIRHVRLSSQVNKRLALVAPLISAFFFHAWLSETLSRSWMPPAGLLVKHVSFESAMCPHSWQVFLSSPLCLYFVPRQFLLTLKAASWRLFIFAWFPEKTKKIKRRRRTRWAADLTDTEKRNSRWTGIV